MCHVINIYLKSSETITSFVLNRNETEYAHKFEGHHRADREVGPGRRIRDRVLQLVPGVDIVFWKGGLIMTLNNFAMSKKNVSH